MAAAAAAAASRIPSKGNSEVAKQLCSLRDALRSGSVSETQGVDYMTKTLSDDRVVEFISKKLSNQQGGKNVSRKDSLHYLERHTVGEDPSPDELETIKALILCSYRDGLAPDCAVSGGYLQVKIPCTDRPVSPSDKQNSKHCGVIQVQSYALASLIHNIPEPRTGTALATAIDNLVSRDNGRLVCAHLCKEKCLQPQHVVFVGDAVNKKHDYCPAWFVVNKKPISFCSCSEDIKCLAPGPAAGAHMTGQAIAEAVETASQGVHQMKRSRANPTE